MGHDGDEGMTGRGHVGGLGCVVDGLSREVCGRALLRLRVGEYELRSDSL
jgi:hypothetical protein